MQLTNALTCNVIRNQRLKDKDNNIQVDIQTDFLIMKIRLT